MKIVYFQPPLWFIVGCLPAANIESSLRVNGPADAVEGGQSGNVSLNTSDVAADRLHGRFELFLTTAGDEDVGTFSYEELCGSHQCVNDLSVMARLELREEKSAPVLVLLREKLLEWKEQLLPKHPMAEA